MSRISHCFECGSELCGHGACPECNPCKHCYGGDRSNKYFGEDDYRSEKDDRYPTRDDEEDGPRYFRDF